MIIIIEIYLFTAYLGPKSHTVDNLDYGFTANYLGHFLFTRLLLADYKLPQGGDVMRVINLTSDAYNLNHLGKSAVYYYKYIRTIF